MAPKMLALVLVTGMLTLRTASVAAGGCESTTTTTSTSTCPPTTALYCGSSACAPPGLCPRGMVCSSATCRCEGPAVACGDLNGALCRWGTCPAGMTCGPDPASTACPPACACH